MDCQFSFGPNGAFFCKSDSIWAWSDNNTLPEPLRLIFEDPNHPQANKFPYDVSFCMEHGQWCMSWKTVKGEDYYEELFLGPRYSKLAEFMRNLAKAGDHTIRTVFGPNASYFTTSSSGFSWQHLPPVLETDIIARLKKAFPTNVSLGIHGTFVAMYADGNITFDVATHYPAVDAMIRDAAENARRKGISYIALNPHAAGQYYVAYGDGSASWNLPNDWSEDVITVSKSLRPAAAARMGSTLPSLGSFATVGGTASAAGAPASGLPSYASSEAQAQTPTTPSGLQQAAQGLGKLWQAYQQQQTQQQQTASPFATQFDPSSLNLNGGFDPSSLTAGFDPSTLTADFDPSTLAGAFDPSTLAAGLDPNNILTGVNTINALFGNSS